MRRSLLLAVSLAIATAAASAQTTWHNVHFGESRDDVRSQITAQNMPLSTSQDGTLQSNTDYELALPGLRHTFPMLVSFHFADDATLTDVTLALDLPGMKRYWAAIGPDEALLNFAAEHLTGALTSIYGAPLYRSTACDADPKQPSPFCILSWRGADQTVEIERSAGTHGQRLLIRYQPLATDL
jgi:hypothetical protein